MERPRGLLAIFSGRGRHALFRRLGSFLEGQIGHRTGVGLRQTKVGPAGMH